MVIEEKKNLTFTKQSLLFLRFIWLRLFCLPSILMIKIFILNFEIASSASQADKHLPEGRTHSGFIIESWMILIKVTVLQAVVGDLRSRWAWFKATNGKPILAKHWRITAVVDIHCHYRVSQALEQIRALGTRPWTWPDPMLGWLALQLREAVWGEITTQSDPPRGLVRKYGLSSSPHPVYKIKPLHF